MQFTEEHRRLRGAATRFVDAGITPHVMAWEAAEQVPPRDALRRIGALGLLATKHPEKDGGPGLHASCAMVEEPGRTRRVQDHLQT